MAEMPVIDNEKCDVCGLCVSVCRCGAIVIVEGVVTIIETEECLWCTQCEAVCRRGAISCFFEISVE